MDSGIGSVERDHAEQPAPTCGSGLRFVEVALSHNVHLKYLLPGFFRKNHGQPDPLASFLSDPPP